MQYATNAGATQRLVADLHDAGVDAWSVRADLSSPQGVDELVCAVDQVIERDSTHEVTALVNNAGLMLSPSFGSATAADFDRYLALNARAPLLLTQALADRMRSVGGVVNVFSVGTHFASPGDIVYAMSKAALESLTKNAAPALAERGIGINTVLPGFTDNGHPAFRDVEVRAYLASYAALGLASK